jgi:hypothetical protein
MKVLVIDDTELQVTSAINQLSKIVDVELVIARSFSEAEKALKSEQFDVVLSDLMMPGESGYQTGKGDSTPYGFAIALLAIKKGVKKIAIVSNGQGDANHHVHPIFGALDSFTGKISDQLFVFAGYSCPCMSEDDLPGIERPWSVKDWGFVFETLLSGEYKTKPKKASFELA